MAIAIRGTATYATTGATTSASLSIAAPTGLAIGDVILIWAARAAASPVWAVTGFTAVTAASNTSISGQLLYRVADGSEGSTFNVTTVTARIFAAVCVAFSGVNNASPFDQLPSTSGQLNAASSSVASNSVTTTAVNDELVWIAAVDSATSGGTPDTLGVPSGFTASGAGSATSAAAAINAGVICGVAAQPTAGSIGSKSVADANINVALLVALQPALIANTITAKALPASSGLLVRSAGKKASILSTAASLLLNKVVSKRAVVSAAQFSYFPFFFPNVSSGPTIRSSAFKVVGKPEVASVTSLSKLTGKNVSKLLAAVSSSVTNSVKSLRRVVIDTIVSVVTAVPVKLKIVIIIATALSSSLISRSVGKIGSVLSNVIAQALTPSAKIQMLLVPAVVNSASSLARNVGKLALAPVNSAVNIVRSVFSNTVVAVVNGLRGSAIQVSTSKLATVTSLAYVAGSTLVKVLKIVASVASSSSMQRIASHVINVAASVVSVLTNSSGIFKSVLASAATQSGSAVVVLKTIATDVMEVLFITSSSIKRFVSATVDVISSSTSKATLSQILSAPVVSSMAVGRSLVKQALSQVITYSTNFLQSSVIPDIIVNVSNRVFTVLARLRGNK